MTKQQWAAVYAFCEEFGCSPRELLDELKENGTVDRHTKLEELGDYPMGTSYNEMLEFLARHT